MIHSLHDLKSGQLKGTKRLKLSCELTTFPEDILTLSETLEVLDLSDNQLSELPESFAQLKRLKIVFISQNNFSVFPKVLAKCPDLTMIGFKSNRIEIVPEQSFPPLLKWLILTDNKIKVLPKSIGEAKHLQKCMLAGNDLETLPQELSKCINLELLRISANKLKVLPEWLFKLPKLSWLAFSGNPATYQPQNKPQLELVSLDDITISETLGEGASGVISKAQWHSKNKEVAVKVFKGAVTSDGLPEDELQISVAVGTHSNLIPVLGQLKSNAENKEGLIMQLITANYINLGLPPTLDTCTRDVFKDNTVFNPQELLKLVTDIASVGKHLHEKGINHGDFYAHNILVNETKASFLGDFGASSFYDTNSPLAQHVERLEIRAFGCLVEDVFALTKNLSIKDEDYQKWQTLINDCKNIDVSKRPLFETIVAQLNTF